MSGLDGLEMLDAHDVTDEAAADNLPEGDEIGSIAENVAYCNYPVLFAALGKNVAAFLLGLGDGLFEQNVVALGEGQHTGFVVKVVRKRDDHCISQFRRGHNLVVVAEPVLLGNIVGIGHFLQTEFVDV